MRELQKVKILDSCRNAYWKVIFLIIGKAVDTADSGLQIGPEGINIIADRGYDTQAGNDYSFYFRHIVLFLVNFTVAKIAANILPRRSGIAWDPRFRVYSKSKGYLYINLLMLPLGVFANGSV